jgi:hypothetical protein
VPHDSEGAKFRFHGIREEVNGNRIVVPAVRP